MSPSVLIIAGAVGLGVILLIIGLIYERRHQQEKKQATSKKSTSEQPRSRVYDVQIRDHRRSFIWTSVITATLVTIALLEWSTFQFRGELPTTTAVTTQLNRGESFRRGDTDYYVDAWYRFEVNGTRYEGSGRLSYETESRRDEVYNNLRGGSGLRVWYHPLLPLVSFPWKTGPFLAIVLLVIASLTGLGMISSGFALVTTKMKGGPRQKPDLTVTKGEF